MDGRKMCAYTNTYPLAYRTPLAKSLVTIIENLKQFIFPVSSATTGGSCLHIFYYSRPSLTVCFNYIQYFDLSTHKGDHTQSLCMIIRSIRESARFPRYICVQFCQVSSFILKPDVVLPRASLRAGNCMDINQFGSIIRFGTQFLQ